MNKSIKTEKHNLLKIFIMLFFLITLSNIVLATQDEVIMHFFYDESCPHCTNQKQYNALLENEFSQLNIKSYQPFINKEDRQIYFEMARELGVEPRGVPLTIIEDNIWPGFAPQLYEEMRSEIVQLIDTNINESVNYSINDSNNFTNNPINDSNSNNNFNNSDNILRIPYIGIVDLNTTPLWVSTVFIAIMDGFNPCSLWLLIFLIGVLVLTRSRKKMIIVGFTFLAVTALAYGLFISGLFSIFTYVHHLKIISYIVGIIALIFGLVNIKDYFYYKKGISFTISDKHKPGLFSKMRNILHPDNSLFRMVGATALLALGVTLVELPCTAGFPLIWSNLVASQNVSTLGFIGLLSVYLLLYLGIEIIILISAIISMNKLNFGESHGRILKFISGIIMLVFAYVFVFQYSLLENISGLFIILLVAFILIFVVLLLHRKILPFFGINIGSEELIKNKTEQIKKEKNKKFNNKKFNENKINENKMKKNKNKMKKNKNDEINN